MSAEQAPAAPPPTPQQHAPGEGVDKVTAAPPVVAPAAGPGTDAAPTATAPFAVQTNGGSAAAAAGTGGADTQGQSAGPPALLREQRFYAALNARVEGKGVKPRQGCASEQLNRECKENTKSEEFTKFLDIVRGVAESEVLARYGTNAGSFDRADFLQVDRPLLFAAEMTDKHFHNQAWQSAIPANCGKGPNELKWLTRHTIAQLVTAAKRQMRYNQVPRKMLQRLQMQNQMQAQQRQEGGHLGRTGSSGGSGYSSNRWDGEHGDAGLVHGLSNAGMDAKAAEQCGGGQQRAVQPAPPVDNQVQRAKPWDDDKRVIHTATARNRIETSLAAIQTYLRSGCRTGNQSAIHKTVQLTYALVFGTICPMLQSIYNLSVAYQRDFDLCQHVLCMIAGTLVRLFGSGWKMSLPSILAPGMREFSLAVRHGESKMFDKLEVAVCFVWACFLKSAERNFVSQNVLDSWSSIPHGMWGEGRTDAVQGFCRPEEQPSAQRQATQAAQAQVAGGSSSPLQSQQQPPPHHHHHHHHQQ